jgi:hypothetical protein
MFFTHDPYGRKAVPRQNLEGLFSGPNPVISVYLLDADFFV